MREAIVFKDTYEEKLGVWYADIAKLKAKACQQKPDAAITLHHLVEKLEAKHTALQQKLKEISDQSNDTWSELRSSIEQAGSDLGGSIKAAVHKFESRK